MPDHVLDTFTKVWFQSKPIETDGQIKEILDQYFAEHGLPPSVNGKPAQFTVTIKDGQITIEPKEQ